MHRACGFDLQCRERSARRGMEQVLVLAREIRARRRVSAIILYGSFSRGDFHEESDVDLIVVGDFPERPHKRAAFIIGLTDEEFAGLIREENPFVLQALAEGTRCSLTCRRPALQSLRP